VLPLSRGHGYFLEDLPLPGLAEALRDMDDPAQASARSGRFCPFFQCFPGLAFSCSHEFIIFLRPDLFKFFLVLACLKFAVWDLDFKQGGSSAGILSGESLLVAVFFVWVIGSLELGIYLEFGACDLGF
jgi:hypothetical protein